jgi:hypothetical protein
VVPSRAGRKRRHCLRKDLNSKVVNLNKIGLDPSLRWDDSW